MSGADPAALLSRAETLLELRRSAEAKKILGAVLAAEPDNHRAYCLLALACDRLDQPADMLQAANQAVRVAPDQEWGHRLASIALLGLGDVDVAVRAAAEAVRLDPRGYRTHLQYALAAAREPRYAEGAYAAAQRAAELAPHSADAHFALGYASQSTGRRDKVADHYREALRLDPQHSSARNNLANLRSNLRLGSKAAAYAAVLRTDPSAEYARLNLEAMFGRMLLGLTILGTAAIAACAATSSTYGFSSTRAVIGAVTVLGAAAYVLVTARAVPPGARLYLRRAVLHHKGIPWLAVITLGVLVLALVSFFSPTGSLIARDALRPLGLCVVGLLAGMARGTRGRRRSSVRGPGARR